jgi:hypothetical protein
MTKYVKINEDVQMHGAELEHGQVYPVERISPSTGMYTIRDASDWPYEFAPGEVTEVDEIQGDSLWAALNLAPNPAPEGKFFIMHTPPDNPDAPTMRELNLAQDISGYTTSFEFSLEDPNESQMLPDEEEVVNHPAHYGGDSVYEAIKVIEAWGLDFHLGNATKYIARAGKKDPETEIQDLEKSRWYIDRRISSLKAAREDEDA